MMQRTRPDEPWIRSAARGVAYVVLVVGVVAAAGTALSYGFAWMMG